MSDYEQLKRAFSVLLGGTLAASILGFFSIGLVARGIGVEEFGIFAILTSYLLIVDKLVNFQSWQALIKFGSIIQESTNVQVDKNAEIQKISAFCFLIDLSTSLLGFILAILFAKLLCSYFGWGAEIYSALLIYSCSMLFKFSSFGLGLFRLLQKHKIQAKVIVLSALLKFILTLTAFYYEKGILTYLLIWGGTDIFLSLLTTACAYMLLKSATGLKNPFAAGVGFNKKVINFVFWTNLSGLIDLPAKELDVMAVGVLASEKEAGLYKLAKQVITLIGRLATPLYQSIYPIQVNSISKGAWYKAVELSNKVSRKLLIVSIIIILLGYFSLDYIIPAFLGLDYITLIPIAFLALVVKSLDIIFTTYHSLFIAFGYVRQNVVILTIANSLLMLLFYFIVPGWGAEGALYCIAFQSVLTLSLKLIYIHSKNREPYGY